MSAKPTEKPTVKKPRPPSKIAVNLAAPLARCLLSACNAAFLASPKPAFGGYCSWACQAEAQAKQKTKLEPQPQLKKGKVKK